MESITDLERSLVAANARGLDQERQIVSLLEARRSEAVEAEKEREALQRKVGT